MEILEEVLERIKPDNSRRERLKSATEEIMDEANRVISGLDIHVKPKLVGSAARGTWLTEDIDIDIFLLFPEDTSRKKLTDLGLEIGKKITRGEGKEQYAEHPYITCKKYGKYGFNLDVVPCYDVEDPKDLRSSVDRSPHHQKYIKKRLTSDLKDQVLLLKKFLKGIGVYGSELETRGFSGYLSELLILHYNSFLELVESAKDWGSNKAIVHKGQKNSEELNRLFSEQSLVFVDPVDPQRNVAAAVSKKNYATFVRACQDFDRNPTKKFFFPNPLSLDPEEFDELLEVRDSDIFLIFFDIPFDLVPDIIYPQLRKTEKSLQKRLEDTGFEVLRSDIWSEEHKAVILIELKYSKLPGVKKHYGPPVGVDPIPFLEKHDKSKDKLSGPYIDEDGRLVFDLRRRDVLAGEVLKSTLESPNGFGSHIKKSVIQEGFKITKNGGVLREAERLGALGFLAEYLTKSLPWYR